MKTKDTQLVGDTAGLSAAQQELFDLLLREEGVADQEPTIPRRENPREPAPLSFAQERLWFLQQLDPASAAYHIPIGLRLFGHLDLGKFAASLGEIIRRHESLRTTFESRDAKPVQVMSSGTAAALPLIDLDQLLGDRRQAETSRIASRWAGEPFDLRRGPLVRMAVIRLGTSNKTANAPPVREHVFLCTMHHIVSDGWSIGVLVQELAALYRTLIETHSRTPRSPLPALPVQYADFSCWQREWLSGEVLDQQLDFWRTQLADLVTLELATDRPRPSPRQGRGDLIPVHLEPVLSRRIAEFAQRHDMTLFMTLQAVLAVLLSRMSGQSDITVGSPIANRQNAGTESLIGYFVNTLTMRLNVAEDLGSGNPTFHQILTRSRQVAVDAFAHQALPFERLVLELEPERDTSRTPIFQLMLIVQNAPLDNLQLPGLELEPLLVSTQTAKFDLTISFAEPPDEASNPARETGITGSLEYDRDLFDRSTMERFWRHFVTLTQAVVGQPDAALSEHSLLSTGERLQVVETWNATNTEYPRDCIHHHFEAQAERTPDALAVTFEDRHLSYHQLDGEANQLAHRLLALGVATEDKVGLLLERSARLLAALLGVLKAGAAYVPLDPSYPDERLGFMLEDFRGAGVPPVVLTEQAQSARLRSLGAAQAILLDGPSQRLAEAEDSTRPQVAVGLDNAAYVIYTSGSTGRPKGTVNSHRGVSNRLVWVRESFGLPASERVLQKTPLGFDVSVWELFAPLLTGARVVFARPGGHQDPRYLARLIRDAGITTAHFVPSMLRIFIEQPDLEALGCLGRVVCSGEALPIDLARRVWRRLGPSGTELHNLYGPTEAAVDVTWWPCPPSAVTRVPIGRPIANTRVYVLDAALQPIPVGLPGELHLGGVQLARGYLHRPGLTAEKFIPHPLVDQPGQRLYKTGDQTRWLDSGDIEFFGRLDDQVKIRGLRIELGEIEATLARHAAVGEAAVLVRDEGTSGPRLVAFLTASGEGAGTTDFRAHMARSLPDYMVPSAFVLIDELPLNASGKLDRGALRRRDLPDSLWQGDETTFVAPRTALEEWLADIWSELLGVEPIGVEHSFFELGGHSLLATQVTSRIHENYQVELSLRRFFARPTVAGLAEALEEALAQMDDVERARIARMQRIPRRAEAPSHPLSFAQQRLWFLHELSPDSPYYNMPRTLRMSGKVEPPVLAAVLREIVRRHENLRTTFSTVDGRPAQIVAPSLAVELPWVDLSGLPAGIPDEEARRIGSKMLAQPFHLDRGPLLRLLLVDLNPRLSVLFLSIHHIVSDGWSQMLIFKEVAELYGAFSQGLPSPLPELPVQYADFTVWQRQWLTEEVLNAQLKYWLERMAGAPGLLELPSDRPRPPIQSLSGDHLRFSFPTALTGAVRELAEKRGILLYVTLLSAFQTLIHRYTGLTDLVLGSPIANRHKKELESVVGFFVNMLLARADLSENPSFSDLLDQVQSDTLAAYDHQDVPFEQVVEALQPERNLSYTPLFQVMFNLLNFPISPRKLPDLAIDAWNIATGTSKYDLSFYAGEDDGVLGGFFEYSTELFDRTTVVRMVGHLQNLLTAGLADSHLRLTELPLLPPAELHEILVERNAGDAQETGLIHHLFERRVEAVPNAVAVVAGATTWTYRRINQRANQLARYLRRAGVTREAFVGLATERSADLVVAMLAVLKAGGAYVPLDPAFPAARLALMVDDARPTLLLTHAGPRRSLPAFGGQVLSLDEDWPEVAAESQQNLSTDGRPGGSPGQLAYVIYTSGSTGRPKGVAVAHGSVVNFLRSMERRPGLTAADVFLAVTTVSFDIAGLEIYLPLLVGARLWLASQEEASDGPRLAAKIALSRATSMQATPATWNMLVETGFAGGQTLRILCGGEALAPTLADQLLARGAEVWNLYGPTEATIWSSVHRVRRQSAFMPLGRPIAATTFQVLDRDGAAAPLGVPGELLIGGAGLARGYLRRPRLSAERFVPDPHGGERGSRLYRTGDLTRLRPAGKLEFLGRIDHQVKVRGFRIELGEVEAALAAHPAVGQAIVVAQRQEDGGDRLAAYLVPDGETPTVADLRRGLGERLPDYMVPSVFIVLQSLPLTPSGKVDRKALPSPDGKRPELGTRFQPPETALERFIESGWRRVLSVDRIGVHDRFFDLGGNSIQAAIFINALQRELGEIIHVTALFQAQSIAELAAFLERDYSAAVRRFHASPGGAGEASAEMMPAFEEGIDAFKILEMRRLAAADRRRRRERRGQGADAGASKVPAIFVLSPPRAGSTLLRVMLAGHPRLFAPPELELLSFANLGERKRELSGGHAFAREGLLRAVMELEGCDADSAKSLLASHEDRDANIVEIYEWLHERAEKRTLVDKTSTYALDPEALARAEELFEAPFYIHLSRHPCASLKSYVDVRLDQFLRFETSFTARQQAELLWVIDHQNVLRFLQDVPPERQYHLRFEDLVTAPETAVRDLCDHLGLEYAGEMLDPYQGPKMTDGIYAQSRMHGDPRFHEHSAIDPAVVEKWKDTHKVSDLAEITRQLAETLGYEGMGYKDMAPREAAFGAGPTPLQRKSGEGLDLSFAQERLWILDRLDPGTDAYNITNAVRLHGDLDQSALALAVSETRRRHASLRTTFHHQDGQPVQVIHAPPTTSTVPRVDLRRLREPHRQSELRRLLAEESASSFDLGRGPLLRLRLITLAEDEHVLQLNMHHIVSDGWSLGILTEELALLYGAYRLAEPSPLPEIKIQYADYAAWQRRELSGAALEAHLDYWRGQLGDLTAGPSLPTDLPRRVIRGFRGEHLQMTLPDALSEGLEALSRSQGVTLFMTMLGAFKVLLSRWTGASDVVVGTPIATRGQDEVERLIGIFLNTLVLRTDLTAAGNNQGADFSQVLNRLKGVALGAYEHQELPFEKLLDDLQPERDLSRTPLFQTFFNMLNVPHGNLEVPGLLIEDTGMRHEMPSKFDLTLYVQPSPHGPIGLNLVYNSDLFAAARMSEFLAQYALLLAQVVEDPCRAIGSYSLHTAAAAAALPDPREALSAAWEGSVPEWVARRARSAPEQIAVVSEDGAWTYRELTSASGRLARCLATAGVEPGRSVAIYAHRSPTLIWAILGVLEAGAAFVILDPANPAARQIEMLRLAQPAAWLRMEAAGPVPEELGGYLDELSSGPRWDLPAWSTVEAFCGPARTPERALPPGPLEDKEVILPSVGPDDLAYIAFTSGSTGAPKGIEGRHGPLTHFLGWQKEQFGLGEGDRYSLLSGLAHDPLQRDIFTSLCLGATLVVPDAGRIFETGYLADWMRRTRVSVAHLTPAMGQLLAERPTSQAAISLPALRYTFLVGDVLTGRDVDRMRRLAPNLTCVNYYGTTETQRAVGYFVTSPASTGDHQSAAIQPLGRGMRDVQLLVVTPSEELASIGELGEIWVRSPHLARGYLGDDSLTRERFWPNPFTRGGGGNGSDGGGDRIYRTGDLGYYLPSGDVVFAGRADHQVKVRGFRIELAEIESVLGRHPEVREVVIEARTPAGGETSLIAWVVAESSATEVQDLRRFLAQQLPGYMVPASFALLEALPLTPNGKVDRRRLASLEAPSRSTDARGYQPPESDLEEQLIAVWREVLAIDKIGVHDNFFDLGGHSLLLVRLHGRLEELLSEKIPLMDLFSHPNVRALAEHLEQRRKPAGEPDASRDVVAESRHRAQRQVAAAKRRKRRGLQRGRRQTD